MRQKLSGIVLAVLLTGLLFLAGLQVKQRYFPAVIQATDVPFGIPSGTDIPIGDPISLYSAPRHFSEEEKRIYEKAALLSRTGDPSSAQALIGVLKETRGQDPALLALQIRNGVERGDEPTDSALNLAEKQLDELLVSGISSPLLQMAKAELLLQRGAAAEASERLRAVIASSPQAFEPRALASRAYLATGQLDSARVQAQWSISLSSPSLRGGAYALLAEAHHRSGKLDSARIVTEFAMLLYPNVRDLMLLRARLYEYGAMLDAATALYSRLDELFPGDRAVALARSTLGAKRPPLPTEVTGCAGDWEAWLDDLSVRYGNDPEATALLVELRSRLVPERAPVAEPVSSSPSAEEEALATRVERAAQGATEGEIDRYGHFRVRWGASEKEFLNGVDSSSFEKMGPGVWKSERFYGGERHRLTAHLGPEGFFKVQLLIVDTTGQPGDLLGRTLRALTRRSGQPRATGDAECPGLLPFQGFVWESKDEFALLAQFRGRDNQVRMVRVDPSLFSSTPSLCEAANWMLDWRPSDTPVRRDSPSGQDRNKT